MLNLYFNCEDVSIKCKDKFTYSINCQYFSSHFISSRFFCLILLLNLCEDRKVEDNVD